MRLISFEKNDITKDYEITIKDWRGTRVYVGDCTVWRDRDTGRRPGTTWEGILADIWASEKRKLKLLNGSLKTKDGDK
jgi:hypothetical protein